MIRNRNNGKVYIGQSRDLRKRLYTHKWLLDNNRHFNKHLQRAWNKGDLFDFKVIETCDREECNEREIFWIGHYKATDDAHGYNLCNGGDTTDGRKCTEETKQRISKARIGKKVPREIIEKRGKSFRDHMRDDPEFAKAHRARMSELGKLAGKKSKGRKCPEEQKRIVSEKLKGRIITEEHKKKLRELYSGEGSPSAKLKELDVIDIRIRFLKGERQRDIQKDYQVTPQTIYDIVRNRRWKSIPNNLEELEVLRCKETI